MTGAGNPTVVVVGAGLDLAVVAFAVANKLQRLRPTVIAVDTGKGEPQGLMASFSDLAHFHQILGITEKDFIKSVGADPNYGFALNTCSSKKPFIFTDSPYGLMIRKQQFHQLFHIYRQANPNATLDDFNLAARLAKAGKFAPASDNPRSIFNTVTYGYTFAPARYRAFLQQLALKLGVKYLSADDIELVEAGDRIDKVIINAGQEIKADFYIDCSAERVLINKRGADHGEYTINSEHVPRWQKNSVEHQRPSAGARSLCAEISSTEEGFSKRTIQGNTAFDESVSFAVSGESDALENCEHHPASGLSRPWVGNCVALGTACIRAPNIVPGAYNILQGQVLHLLDLWSGTAVNSAAAHLFNQTSQQTMQHVVDLINIQLAAHPRLSRQVGLTESNRRRVELFTASGASYLTENAIITDQHWPALLMALGYEQAGVNMQVRGLDSAEINAELNKLNALLQRATDAAQPYSGWR